MIAVVTETAPIKAREAETLRRNPDEQVMTWLAVHDQELAIPTVTIAEIAYGIARILPDERSVLLMPQGMTL